MPKKKNKKKFSERDDSVTIESASDESENEVTDGRKYSRRQIQSNWEKYRSVSPDLREEETGQSEDFASLLNAPSNCNYFQFKSEKKWESEASNSSLGGHKFFNLDLEFLSSGLGCIPFYDRVDLDPSILSECDVEKCNKRAEECRTRFKPILEKFLKKLEHENELCSDGEELQVNLNVIESSKQTEPRQSPVNMSMSSKCDNNIQILTEKDIPKTLIHKNVENVCSGEEDLENWLDSVLDD